jgi:hypothetical protein
VLCKREITGEDQDRKKERKKERKKRKEKKLKRTHLSRKRETF